MEIPLFPLHTVLCPGIALPLHIFEPRYRLLIERCIADETPFGVVLIREGREVGGDEIAIAGVGTVAEIRHAKRHPDGRYDLLVVGTTRFLIDEVDADAEPYLVARVEPLEDQLGDPDRTVRLGERLMRRFVSYLQLLRPLEGETAEEIDVQVEVDTEPASSDEAADPQGRRLVIPDDPTVLSHLLSGILQVENTQRQVLLEADTTEERLARLDEILDRELWMLRRRLRSFKPDPAQAAARRN